MTKWLIVSLLPNYTSWSGKTMLIIWVTTLVINPKNLWSLGWNPQKVTFFKLKKYSWQGTPFPSCKLWITYFNLDIGKLLLQVLTCPPFLSPCHQSPGWRWYSALILLCGSFLSQPEYIENDGSFITFLGYNKEHLEMWKFIFVAQPE